ncbi:MAG: outer membrane protein assembly factor BamA [Gammaproteobacteria bacterium]
MLAGLCVLLTPVVFAQDGWVVRNFQVEGTQWISEGTVYNYLPINIGDTIDDQLRREAFRALYDTGFFQDIEFRRDGDTLIIAVLERPRIDEFTFSGNEDIDDEQLEESMAGVGLSVGKTFDRSILEEVTQYLTDQYHGRGKYAATVNPVVEPLPDNRVRVAIEINEGERAKIREINIIGNTVFDDDELLENFELSTGGLLSFIRNDDRYSKEALEGDLETLRSYYMDRGYADFRLESPQVTISPDKRDIFVTIGIDEGELYTISDVDVAGELVVPAEQLRGLIFAQPGQIFSQQLLTFSEESMTLRLGQDGYAFAQVRAVPDLDEENKTVSVRFFVDPQNRVYVRRINFLGADSVNDEVFRREMRQMEGAYLSNLLVDRSQILLQRLPYVESVEYDTVPVPGSPDLVDINFEIVEGLPGQFGGSIGFSDSQGIILGGNFIHSNFMGTGNRVSLDLRGGEYYKVYDMNFTDAYRTMDGLARTISFTYQDIKQFTSSASDFSTQTLAAGLNWAYPITEYQSLRFGFSAQHAEMATSFFSSDQAKQWVRANGESQLIDPEFDTYATAMDSLELVLGWSFDSRNRTLFPDAGSLISFSLNAAIPGSDVEYFVTRLDFTRYFRLPGAWRFKINSDLAFGDAYGDQTTALPPFRNFFGGGPGSVRGFKESYLGPVDSQRNPNGGNMLVANQFELIIPTPEKIRGSTRISLFYDVGNVFHTGGIDFYDRLGDPVDYDFDYDRLKHSVGIAVEWLAPLGLLRFSYASPLNARKDSDRFYADQTEQFQFNVGNAF